MTLRVAVLGAGHFGRFHALKAAKGARTRIEASFDAKQRTFLEFVLQHYVSVGVEELDQQKLTPLLRLKYGAIQDAIAAVGQPEEIGRAFAGFQKYLYAEIVP